MRARIHYVFAPRLRRDGDCGLAAMRTCPECGYSGSGEVCPRDGLPLRDDVLPDDGSEGDELLGRVVAQRYRLEEVVGRGGMAWVFRARHLVLEEPVAIKIMRPHVLRERTALRRFLREARASTRLKHPNTIRVFDCGLAGDPAFPYIAMEYLEGQTLATLVERNGPVAPGLAVRLAAQVCKSLHEAHALGMVHRDLKPHNVFVTEIPGEPPFAKVLDFGLVKFAESTSGVSVLSASGSFAGTPRYMSPEQIGGHDLDGRSDLYSLGILLFEMLTGAPPFTSDNLLELLALQATAPAPPLATVLPEGTTVPPALCRLVDELLSKDPARRPATAERVGQRLVDAFGQHEPAPGQVFPRADGRAGGALGGETLVGRGGLAGGRPSPKPEAAGRSGVTGQVSRDVPQASEEAGRRPPERTAPARPVVFVLLGALAVAVAFLLLGRVPVNGDGGQPARERSLPPAAPSGRGERTASRLLAAPTDAREPEDARDTAVDRRAGTDLAVSLAEAARASPGGNARADVAGADGALSALSAGGDDARDSVAGADGEPSALSARGDAGGTGSPGEDLRAAGDAPRRWREATEADAGGEERPRESRAPAPRRPRRVWVRVVSDPPGADVWVDGAHRGRTPFWLDETTGRTLRLVPRKGGYYGVPRKVTVGPSTRRIGLELRQPAVEGWDEGEQVGR